MEYQSLLVSIEEGTAYVTLNRPHVLNALNAQVFDDLQHVFQHLSALSSVRVILLSGAGERAFAAGADIPELQGLDESSGTRKSQRGHEVFNTIESCGKPVIALIKGFALGGGCELAMACTLRIAADTATFGQPEVKLGLTPGYGGTQRLPRLVGLSTALRLLLTGEMIPAREALRIGLVDEVVAVDQLRERGSELAHLIAANAPLAVAACLRAVYSGCELGLTEALAQEAVIFGQLCATQDKSEGLSAFRDRRKAIWTGC